MTAAEQNILSLFVPEQAIEKAMLGLINRFKAERGYIPHVGFVHVIKQRELEEEIKPNWQPCGGFDYLGVHWHIAFWNINPKEILPVYMSVANDKLTEVEFI